MRLRLRAYILSFICFVLCCFSLGAQQTRIVDFKANIMTPIKTVEDSSALKLVGDVVFYHNGAIITCDSAIRYGNRRMECYNNVVINQKDTYIYGDRADYNGDDNMAQVFAPIIKVVDNDATMYTYNFKFNTLDEIGYYYGNATIEQGDNLIESNRGYYHTNDRTFSCVSNVQVSNPDYKLKSDSLNYNMDIEFARFYTPTWIWNTTGDILSSNRGAYDNLNSIYYFYKNSYILSQEQEIWADSIDYFYAQEDAIFKKNIQILDTVNQVLAFGDYAQYWDAKARVLLTRNPSLVAYDQVEDSLFLSADTMFIYTLNKFDALAVVEASKQTGDEELLIEEIVNRPMLEEIDSLLIASDSVMVDSTMVDSLAMYSTLELEQALDDDGEVVLTKKQLREIKKQEKKKKKAEKKAEKDRIRQEKARALAIKRGYLIVEDSLSQNELDSLAILNAQTKIDSLQTDIDSLLMNSVDSLDTDSLMRVLRAYHNVKVYRTDLQAVCDSLVGFSVDTTVHMYINPVMWNELNQISSDLVDVYIKNSRLDKAVFTGGPPIMSSYVSDDEYNQVRGKYIEAFFRDNTIFKTDINANAHTLYYMTENDDMGVPQTVGFLDVTSSSTTFDIEDQMVTSITYRGNPVYTIYPMNKIPITQEVQFENFKWEIDRKPTREDIFTRTVLPSQRDAYLKLKQPEFPITKRIFSHIDKMIKSGEWTDRNEVISQEALDFIRSLGYQVDDKNN